MEDWSTLAWITLSGIPVALIMISLWSGPRGPRMTVDRPTPEHPRDPR